MNNIITVHLEEGEVPAVDPADQLFDTGLAWVLYRRDDEYTLVLTDPEKRERFLSAATFSPEEREITLYCGDDYRGEEGHNPFSYPLDQLLTMYFLAPRGGAVIHAAGAAHGGRACLFPGRSGAGKSTLSRQLAGREGWSPQSDDRMVVRRNVDAKSTDTSSSYTAWGTPWAGDAKIASDEHAPLEGIFFLRHGEENRLRPLTPREAFEQLLPMTSIPWYDEQYQTPILRLCEELTAGVPACELHFTPDAAAAEMIEEHLDG